MAVAECMVPGMCPPEGPSTPFGTPLIIVLDTIRLVMLTVGLATVWKLSRVGTLRRDRFLRLGYIGATALILGGVATELDHLGDYAHFHLLLFTVGVGLLAWSIFTSPDTYKPKPLDDGDSAPGQHRQA